MSREKGLECFSEQPTNISERDVSMMSDITWCVNAHCFKKDKCKRYATKDNTPGGRYSVSSFLPNKETGVCAHYWQKEAT